MKLVFKATPAMIENIFNQLWLDSDTFNAVERLVGDKVVPLGTTYLKDGESWEGYTPHPQDQNLHLEVIEFNQIGEFGWTTGGGSRLWVNKKAGTVTVTGSRRAIRERFSDVLCVGWGGELPARSAPAPGRTVGDVDWSQYDRSFKPGLKLTSYETSEPDWLWYETADDHIKTITGRSTWELSGKSASWLAASGLSQKLIDSVLRQSV